MLNALDTFVFCSPWSYAAVGLVIALLVGCCWHEAKQSREGFYQTLAYLNFAAAFLVLSRAYWPLLTGLWHALDSSSRMPAKIDTLLLQLTPVFQLTLIVAVPLALILALYASYQRHSICCALYLPDAGTVADMAEASSDAAEDVVDLVGDVAVDWYQSTGGSGAGDVLGKIFDGVGEFFAAILGGGSSSSSDSSDGGAVTIGLIICAIVIAVSALMLSFLTVWLLVIFVSELLRESVAEKIAERETAYATVLARRSIT